MKFTMRSEAGLKGNNRDAMAIPADSINQQALGSCLAVADGITHCPRGGEVARQAVRIVDLYYEFARKDKPGESALAQALEKLWLLFFEQAGNKEDQSYLTSGCTLTVALVFQGVVYLRHLGDSHCDILLANGQSLRITNEHNNSDGHLTHYFGGERPSPAQEESYPFPVGSTLVLSSDGVSYFVKINLMRTTYEAHKNDGEAFTDELFRMAEELGSVDDKTVLVAY